MPIARDAKRSAPAVRHGILAQCRKQLMQGLDDVPENLWLAIELGPDA
ncbi:MAG: hypothetical protein V9G15_09030 [Dermatophilaceae bacterium]